MDGRQIEIDGVIFDLSDPEEKKAAVRAWLQAKSRERNEREENQPAPQDRNHQRGGG